MALTTAPRSHRLAGVDWREPVDAARARSTRKRIFSGFPIDFRRASGYLRATTSSCASLPDDIDARKAWEFARDAVLPRQSAQLAALQRRFTSREQEGVHLARLIAKLKRILFGRNAEKLARQIEPLQRRRRLCELTSAPLRRPRRGRMNPRRAGPARPA
ncbi:hypothetical protein [Pandoraea sputorum]|uniref:hypothetical protein n=1 Tax=Pandoraea sputorum TaxID=93222 RepID=UPI00123F5337|nr:hypothetical protein [Pandoraea sputorum]